MMKSVWKRTASLALALMLLWAAPITAAAQERFTLIQLKGTDVTLDETVFSYTGQEIRPNVTVRVDGQLLTLDKDYTLSFADNIAVGTGRVIVTGIATASESLGYTGTVEIPFTIRSAETQPEETQPEETEPEETEPEVTEPETTEPEATEPEATEPEETEPEVTEPETTEPEVTEPEETEPEETEPETVVYKITKGNKASWYRESTKALSFTANGKRADFTGVEVDGKELKEEDYVLGAGNTTVTLKRTFLKTLKNGSHTVTILFEDGEATGTFRVTQGLDTSNPETGDNIALWFTLMTASAAALVLLRKKWIA